MRRHIKRLRSENGQALVEFAFVIPLVMLFLFGVIDFGLAINQQNADTNIANVAVREAAVIGSTTSESCGGQTFYTLDTWTECESTLMGGPQGITVCMGDIATGSSPTSNYTQGDPIKVEVSSQFSWLKVITQKVGTLTSHIGANATMRLEDYPSSGGNSFLTNTPVCPS